MVTYMERSGHQVSSAQGPADLTDWDNNQAALVVGELNAIDWFKWVRVTFTKPRTIQIGDSSHYNKRLSVGKLLGRLTSLHYLQTGILTYFVMGACTTTEASPNVHDITKSTSTTPPSIAFHLEREGSTANRRKDVMGVVPTRLSINCVEGKHAFQTFNAEFGYSANGSDLAKPTDLAQATHMPYTWFHYKNSSGASAFTYATGAINCEIIEFTINIGWSGALFGTYDSSGFPTDGHFVPPFVVTVDLGVRLTDGAGTDLDAISDLDSDSYAGDLDLIIDFYESATRYLKFTFDKMFIVPNSYEEVYKADGDWFDGARVTLAFLSESSSLVVQEKNALNNDYYENPA